MFIDKFLAGVLVTIFAEVLALIIWALCKIVGESRHGKL